MDRSVILACSATKRTDTAELSALARYDGPAWRTLRKHLNCLVEPPFALSARFGLISAYDEIPYYDEKLTPARARAITDQVAEQLVGFIRQGRLRGRTFVFGGGVYRDLLENARTIAGQELGREIPMIFAHGMIGEQLGQLKEFLTRRDAE